MQTEIQRRGSRQKMAVLNAVAAYSDHPTADMIFLRVRGEMSGTSLSTVYRNLGILVDEGKLVAVSGPGAEVHYDHKTANHCHVQCRMCGKVSDVMHSPPDFSVLYPEEASGFEIDGVTVTFTGHCKECAAKQKEDGRQE